MNVEKCAGFLQLDSFDGLLLSRQTQQQVSDVDFVDEFQEKSSI